MSVPAAPPDAMANPMIPPEMTAIPAAPAAPVEPEIVSETLYIQNLNEKIKIDG